MYEDNPKEYLKFYSIRAIIIGTIIGSPLAGCYLIRENFLSLNKPNEANKALTIGVVFTIFIFSLIFLLPQYIVDKIPNFVIPIIYTNIIYFITKSLLGQTLDNHKENNLPFYSIWKAVGIGFLSLFVIIIGAISVIILFDSNDALEQYDTNIELFIENETESLEFYDYLESSNSDFLIQELNENSIPNWEENIEIIKQTNNIDGLGPELINRNKLLLEYSKLRLKSFEMFKLYLQDNTDKYGSELEEIHKQVEKKQQELE